LDKILEERWKLTSTTPPTTTSKPTEVSENLTTTTEKPNYAMIQINGTTDNFGIILSRKSTLCFPNINWIIGAKFEPFQTMRDLTDTAAVLNTNLAKYNFEKTDGALIPGKEQEVITDVAVGESKSILTSLIEKMQRKFEKLKPLLNVLSNGIKTVVPLLKIPVIKRLFPLKGIEQTISRFTNLKRNYLELQTNPNLG
jgi:hypothetical protein